MSARSLHFMAAGFEPMDRLQLASSWHIRNSTPYVNAGRGDLPWAFFMRHTDAGLLHVSDIRGRESDVAIEDVCDYRPGKQIFVRAMPRSSYLERLSMSPQDLCKTHSLERNWAPARLVMVHQQNRSNTRHSVTFLDPSISPDCWASIHDDDRTRLQKLRLTEVVPNLYTGGNDQSSAMRAADKKAARGVAEFIAERLNTPCTPSAGAADDTNEDFGDAPDLLGSDRPGY